MNIIFQHVQYNHEERNKRNNVEESNSWNKKTCRFCKSSNAKFDKKAHAVPEFLGNKTVFNVDECDACNSAFGNDFEPHLKRFVGPSFFYHLKGKKGWSKTSGGNGIQLSSFENSQISRAINIVVKEKPKDSKLEISVKGEEFTPIKVYKSILKILLSLIPTKYLEEFEGSFKWLKSGYDFKGLNHAPMVMVGRQPPDPRNPTIMEISITQTKEKKGNIYQLKVKFNNLMIVLPFSPSLKVNFRVGEVIAEPIAYQSYEFELIDFSNAVSKTSFMIKLNRLPINLSLVSSLT